MLLALCSENDLLPSDSEFGRADLAKLLPKCSASTSKDMDTDSNSSGGVTAAMEGLSTADLTATSSALPAAEDETVTGSGAEAAGASGESSDVRSEEHTSELQSHSDLVCRLLLEKKKTKTKKKKKRNKKNTL